MIYLFPVLTVFLISAACFVFGQKMVSRFTDFRSFESWCLGGGIGLGLLAYAVLALGILNLLTSAALYVLVFFVFLAAAAILLFNKRKSSPFFPAWGDLPLSAKWAAGAGFLTLLLSAVTLLAPEMEGDALCYHLHLPRLFLANHNVSPLTYEVNSTFPLLMEMLYTLGLGILNESASKTFHFVLTLTGGGAVFCCLRRLQISQTWSTAGAVFFLTAPGILNQASTCMVDAALASCGALAILTVLAGLENPNNKTWALAGVLSGLAMSVKYTAMLLVFPIAGNIFLLLLIRKKYSEAFISTSIYLALCVLACFYWYLSAYLFRGNPFYPYFAQIFGSGNFAAAYDHLGLPKTFFYFLTSPWWVTLNPERFTGYAEQIGPVYLMFLPFLLLLKKRWNPASFFLAALTISFYSAWFFLGQGLRFLLPLVPLLAVWLGISLQAAENHLNRPLFRIHLLLLTACLLINAVFVGYHFRRFYPLVLGMESRESFLAREERTYDVARYISQSLPADAKIFNSDEVNIFHIKRQIVRDTVYKRMTRYDEKNPSPDEAVKRLRDEKFTHLLLRSENAAGSAPPMARILSAPSDRSRLGLKLVFEKEFKDSDGRVFYYELFRL